MPGPLDRGWGAVVCVASGPSFSVEQAELIAAARAADRCRVIVVNDCWRRIPTADVCYGGDWSWWLSTPDPQRYIPIAGRDRFYLRGVPNLGAVREAFVGESWTLADEEFIARDKNNGKRYEQAKAAGLRFVKGKRLRGNQPLAIGDHRIADGSNGGFQSMMLARAFGARLVVLVGFDMQRTGGACHFFGEHPKAGAIKLSDGNPENFRQCFIDAAPALKAEGLDIINCTISSALTCFRRADLAATLAAL